MDQKSPHADQNQKNTQGNIQLSQNKQKSEPKENGQRTENVHRQRFSPSDGEKDGNQQQRQQKKESKVQDGEEVRFEESAVEEEEDELIEENLEKAQEYKNKGAQFFKAGNEINAIEQYQKAMKYTSDKNLRATLCSNISICLIKDENFQEARRFCEKALKYNQNMRKARTNLARCFENEQKFEEALEEYKKLEQGAPANEAAFIKQKIKSTQVKVDEINEKRKTEVIDGLKNIGNSVLGYFGMSLDNFKLEQGAGGGYNISFKQ